MHSLLYYTAVAQTTNTGTLNISTLNKSITTGFSTERLQNLDKAMADWVQKPVVMLLFNVLIFNVPVFVV